MELGTQFNLLTADPKLNKNMAVRTYCDLLNFLEWARKNRRLEAAEVHDDALRDIAYDYAYHQQGKPRTA